MAQTVSAAVLLIGDEILSGRTQDGNLKAIAEFLAPLGVDVREARVVSDDQARIIAALNQLRSTYDYVFTTGGIGPTHDDITADAVAAAFRRNIDVRSDALELLAAYYAARGVDMNDGRRRMARIPDGADLIANPVSVAPGFQIDNVFVMAGVPSVMRGMLQDVGPRIKGGQRVHARTVRGAGGREGDLAAPLSAIAAAFDDVSIGSYPFMRPSSTGVDYGVNLVARGRNADRVAAVVAALRDLFVSQNITPELDPKD